MNKFTNNAYHFINSCIGNNKDFKISLSGDITRWDKPVGSFIFNYELKNMIITEIEIQYNHVYLCVETIKDEKYLKCDCGEQKYNHDCENCYHNDY